VPADQLAEHTPEPLVGPRTAAMRCSQKDGARNAGIGLESEDAVHQREIGGIAAQRFRRHRERRRPQRVAAVHAQHARNHAAQAVADEHHARSRRIVAFRIEHVPCRVEVALHTPTGHQQRGIGRIDDVPDLETRAQISCPPQRVRQARPGERTAAQSVDHHDRTLVRIVVLEEIEARAPTHLVTAEQTPYAHTPQVGGVHLPGMESRGVQRERVAPAPDHKRTRCERIGDHQPRLRCVVTGGGLEPGGCRAKHAFARQQLAQRTVVAARRHHGQRHAEATADETLAAENGGRYVPRAHDRERALEIG